MNLYLIERTDDWDYDEYDSVVVVAGDSEEALDMVTGRMNDDPNSYYYNRSSFPGFEMDGSNLVVRYIGDAVRDLESGVIIQSFNEG